MVTTRVSHTKPGISFLQQSACNLILLRPQMVSMPTMKPHIYLHQHMLILKLLCIAQINQVLIKQNYCQRSHF